MTWAAIQVLLVLNYGAVMETFYCFLFLVILLQLIQVLPRSFQSVLQTRASSQVGFRGETEGLKSRVRAADRGGALTSSLPSAALPPAPQGRTWSLVRRAGCPPGRPVQGVLPAALFPGLAKSHESANWRSIFKARPLPSWQVPQSSLALVAPAPGRHCKRPFLFPLFNGTYSGSLGEARCELEAA